jgi:ribonuclease P protein component
VPSVDGGRASCCNRRLPSGAHAPPPGPSPTDRRGLQEAIHETNLPSLQGPPRTHARLSRPHEVAWRSRGHQRSARQGAQAPLGLSSACRSGRVAGLPRRTRPLCRVVASADFERALAVRSGAVTEHFAVHHVDASPGSPPKPSPGKLSTIGADGGAIPVEDSSAAGAVQASTRIGAVVPKRHARRAVTRALVKRQIYAAAERHRNALAPGLWIVRLRSAFDRARFASAASDALRSVARSELDDLLRAAAKAPSR